MKLRGTKTTLTVLVSGALMFGVCTSGGDPNVENNSPGVAETVVGGDDPCIHDAGVRETSDGQVVYSPSLGNWSGYSNVTNTAYSTCNSMVVGQMPDSF